MAHKQAKRSGDLGFTDSELQAEWQKVFDFIPIDDSALTIAELSAKFGVGRNSVEKKVQEGIKKGTVLVRRKKSPQGRWCNAYKIK